MGKVDKEAVRAAINIEVLAGEYGITFDKSGRGRCPFSEKHTNGDANPSLGLDRKRGRIRCYSQGCFGEHGVDHFGLVEVMEEVDFKTALYKLAERAGLSNGQVQRITGTWDYRDEEGKLLYQVVRKEPGQSSDKRFVIRQPDGKGDWSYNAKGVRLVPYRLPDLLASKEPAAIPEGEKCVDALWNLGIPATCNPMGAGKWRNFYNDYLQGRDAVIWPDKDDTGARHAAQVARSLHDSGKATSIRIVEPPENLPEKGDVVDGIERLGWTREDVLEILEAAKPFDPESCPPPPIGERGQEDNKITLIPRGAADLIQNSPEVDWLAPGLLPVGRSVMFSGPPSAGKTFMSMDLAIAIDQGGLWLGEIQCKKGLVLVVDEENGDVLLKKRLTKMFIGRGMAADGSTCGIQFLSMAGVNLSDEACSAALERVISEMRPDLVVFDTLIRVHQVDGNSAQEMAGVSRLLKEWYVAYGCAFCINHHDRKPGASGHNSQYAFLGSIEVQAFVDSHIDLYPVTDEQGVLNANHVKSRFKEPLEPFGMEIVDIDGGTVVRYTEQHKTKTRTKQAEAEDFIRGLTAGGEWVSRKEISSRGAEAGHSENTLDAARLAMVEAEELEQKNAQEIGQAGSGVFVRCLLSSCPPVPIGEEEDNKHENLLEVEV